MSVQGAVGPALDSDIGLKTATVTQHQPVRNYKIVFAATNGLLTPYHRLPHSPGCSAWLYDQLGDSPAAPVCFV